VQHRTPMLSIGNAFDEDEVRAFDKRIRRRWASSRSNTLRSRSSTAWR
jgi:NAD-dependent DNA ligase